MLGVEGRYFSVIAWPNGKLANQQFKAARYYKENGRSYRITAKVRFDDECKNGHETFAIVADIREAHGKYWHEYMGGCCHDEITLHFPEFAPLIKWHLCSTDGQMHYPANVLYLASERDCWGLLKGEFQQHTSRGTNQNGGIEGVPNWALELPERAAHDVYAVEKPAPVMLEWKACGRTGEGKARELDHARSSAIWPDATDAELSQDRETLRAVLAARLPALVSDFKAAMIGCGFVYPA
jgi:hypothetical protein